MALKLEPKFRRHRDLHRGEHWGTYLSRATLRARDPTICAWEWNAGEVIGLCDVRKSEGVKASVCLNSSADDSLFCELSDAARSAAMRPARRATAVRCMAWPVVGIGPRRRAASNFKILRA